MSSLRVTPDSGNERNASTVTPRNGQAPLTNAQRQARYRARRKAQAEGTDRLPRTASIDTIGTSAKTARTSTKRSAKPSQSKDTASNEQPEANGCAHQGSGEAEAKPPARDERGRFLAGHTAGGRPLGSRNKLTEDFVADFHDAWLESGPAALRHMVKNDPSAFVRAAVQLMPKDVLVEARGAGLVLVETPAAIRALLEALPDLGVLPLTGPVIDAEASDAEVSGGDGYK